MLDLKARQRGQVLVIGHRGAMGYAPENTMTSFALAVEQGADLIEFDVHLSRDGELVVMHDADVARTCDGKGLVKNLTLAEIRHLDAGVKFDERFRGEHVPTLTEVLDWAKQRLPLVIEIKGDPLPAVGIEEKLVRTLADFSMLDQVLVTSFFHPALRRVKELAPRLATGLDYAGQLADTVGAARATMADSVWPSWVYWTREIVDQVHRAGLAAGSWGVDNPAIMDYLVPLGLDALGSNYPDRLRVYVDRAGLGGH